MCHDGHLNTYSLKDGKKITLAPLGPSQLYKSKPLNTQTPSDLFLTFSEPLLKVSHHEFKASKEWILTSLKESEIPTPTYPFAISYSSNFHMYSWKRYPWGYLLRDQFIFPLPSSQTSPYIG